MTEKYSTEMTPEHSLKASAPSSIVLSESFPRILLTPLLISRDESSQSGVVISIDRSFSKEVRRFASNEIILSWEPYLIGCTLVLKAPSFSLRLEGVPLARVDEIEAFFRELPEICRNCEAEGALKELPEIQPRPAKKKASTEEASGKNRRQTRSISNKGKASRASSSMGPRCNRCGSLLEESETICLICGSHEQPGEPAPKTKAAHSTIPEKPRAADSPENGPGCFSSLKGCLIFFFVIFYVLPALFSFFVNRIKNSPKPAREVSQPVRKGRVKSKPSFRWKGRPDPRETSGSSARTSVPSPAPTPVPTPVPSSAPEPSQPEVNTAERASVLLKEGKLSEALVVYQELLRVAGKGGSDALTARAAAEDRENRLGMASCLEGLGRPEEARQVLMQAYRLHYYDEEYRKRVLTRLSDLVR